MNRQKLGIALDLKNPRGVEILHKLVGKSDVFVENFRKGVAERLGLGYDDLVKDNPTIVYGSASGYGPEGPDSSKPTFALTGEARSGALWWSGPGDETPYAVGIADQAASIMLSYGILGAIIARERFGFGQKVDVSHLGSMESIFLTRPRAEWEHAMEAAGDLIYERVQRTLDLVDDPGGQKQLRSRLRPSSARKHQVAPDACDLQQDSPIHEKDGAGTWRGHRAAPHRAPRLHLGRHRIPPGGRRDSVTERSAGRVSASCRSER